MISKKIDIYIKDKKRIKYKKLEVIIWKNDTLNIVLKYAKND